MTINVPTQKQLPPLRALWQQTFGDPDVFWDTFFQDAFSPDRTRCVFREEEPVAALCWFDTHWEGKRLAYIYAVATRSDMRGQGICSRLMADTHKHLAASGYAGAVLVPAEDNLFPFYRKMGYRPFGGATRFCAPCGNEKANVQEISPAQYLALQQSYLPEGSVLHQAQTLSFYGNFVKYYKGDDCLFVAGLENEKLDILEFFGDRTHAPSVVAYFGCETGRFLTPTGTEPFAMCRLFSESDRLPAAFGISLV